MWGWMAIVGVLAVLYAYYRKSKSNQDQSAGGVNSPGGVDASLVPQFINQVYDQDVPPSAPNITVNNTVPLPKVNPGGPPKWMPPAREPNEPATISGAPGSFTTGLAGGLNEWTSTGKYSLNTIARSHGMTAQQLIAISEHAENNPGLKAYVSKGNLNAPLPAGIQVFIPNKNWKMVKK
jgi:hypothetical protein